MPTYVYETVPRNGEAPRQFEVRQGMKDLPLDRDPDTGEPVRRVISGGLLSIPRGRDTSRSGPVCSRNGGSSCFCCG